MKRRGLLLWQLLMACLSSVTPFDIFDKETNLISYMRSEGSLDPEVDTVRYVYGDIFARIPGKPIQKLFCTEGYNIRKLARTSTGFNLLSREIIVYRDIVTSDILSIWMNPFTKTPNEVFTVQNNPIDQTFNYKNMQATVLIPPEMVCIYSNLFLQTQNILDKKSYPLYSSGPILETNDVYHHFINMTELATSVSPSVNSVISRFRRGPFLPWMEMGDTPGSLFYHQTLWKMTTGFDDVATDILALVRKTYPEFMETPRTFTGQRETSWGVFKKMIDTRRSQGEPDIILPLVTVLKNATTRKQKLDQKIVKAVFLSGEIKVYFNGTVSSEILGKDSIKFFNFDGYARLTLLDYSPDSLLVDTDITGLYRDPVTGNVLSYFYNPIKGETQKIRPFHFKAVKKIPTSSVYSFPLKGQHKISVLYDQSESKIMPDTGIEEWVVNMVSVFVDEEELVQKSPFFYGTWTRYSSWLPWMKMEKHPGNMAWSSNIYQVQNIPSV